MKIKILMISLAAITIAIGSCKKEDTNNSAKTQNDAILTSNLTAAVASIATTEANLTSTEDIQSVSVSKFDFDGMMGEGPKGGPGGPGGPGPDGFMRFDIPRVSSCASVTVSGATYPKTITIDYGTGCAGHHGQIKSGKIIIESTDTIIAAGSIQTITYQDFYVDSMKVELTATLKNLGKNADGNWVIASNYTQKSTNRDTDFVIETYADTIVWTSGFETDTKSDDIFSKTGGGTITINDTLAFSRTITKPLVTDNTCGNIISGTVELYRSGSTVVIDYGSGTCDNQATVTTNGTTETIDLNSHMFGPGGHFGKHCEGRHHGGGFMGGGR